MGIQHQRLPMKKWKNYKPSKETLSDHIYYVGLMQQAADYDTTIDFILNHIIISFIFGNDITTGLCNEDG
jgi:hypothetical protein